MANRFRLPLAALFLGLAMLCLPLKAQLNPKLQGGSTDFLNLYQQSTNTKVKPEVMTIFDYSTSMDALMYHPLFVNNDTFDKDADNLMTFKLTPGVGQFTIKATSDGNTASYETLVINIDGATGARNNTGTNGNTRKYTVTNSSGAQTAITLDKVPTAGATVTFTAYITYSGGASTKTITWSWVGANGGTLTSTSNGSGSGPYKSTVTWKVPTPVEPFVTATLDPRKPGSNPVAGATYLPSVLTSKELVRPDGSLVTKANADAADTGSGLTGATAGSNDVRNWVRAASHVRFATTVGTDTRTIDIPIPWQITKTTSTTNPLEPQTVFDRQIKIAADGTQTIYGSGSQIKLDQVQYLSSGNVVLKNTDANNTTLSLVTYHPAYVSWLFNGKYKNGTYLNDYIIFDAKNGALAGGQGVGNESWGQGYGATATGNEIFIPTYKVDGTYVSEAKGDASKNITPALTRVQAVKRAAIQTWVNFQADVLWAFRFLDQDTEASGGGGENIDNNSRTTYHSGTSGTDSGWTILNNTTAQGGITAAAGNSVNGMNRIAGLRTGNSTPLTYAMARGLAQFTDPKSVFNDVEVGGDAPSQCMNHFLILFTDGVDNNGTGTNNTNGDSPYYIPTGVTGKFKLNAKTGNKAVIANPGNLNRYGSWWNAFTFAGVAAHLGDRTLGDVGVDYLDAKVPGANPSGAANPSAYLPLSLYQRFGTIFTKPHLVTTMTVGVSLGGKYTDAAGPKHTLFLAAATGDPTLPNWDDVDTLQPFIWDDSANSGNGGRVQGSLYYFDATDPDSLAYSLDKAIRSAVGASNINTASSPNTPFIGAALSGEIFIGKFQPPTNGGAIWTGDLLMFGTRLVNDQLQIIDKAGAVTTTVDSSTAQWSAYSALAARNWKLRKLYTRLPGAGLLSTFTYTGTDYTSGLASVVSQGALNPFAASYPANSQAQQRVIQWAMGGDTTKLDVSGVATVNRPNIMGDIINSSPAVIEYRFSDVQAKLPTALSAVGGTRFRLVLVGTNQGYLHAFGEVVKQENATAGNTSTPLIVKGAVDELWSFMPTDFLGYLDQLTVTNNPHRFLVDGTPTVYHLDLPPSTGGGSDGIMEVASEKALVIFGLGKGGRSYYALDIHDPYTPQLKWSLVPDESMDAAGVSALVARILPRPGAPTAATVTKVVQNLGYSTCTPSVARLTLTDSSGKTVVHDAVFFGGGHSIPEMEAQYKDAAGKPSPMGRSILALDAYSGQILAAVDLTTISTVVGGTTLTPGPISRGLVPFEFILNSGMAQRVYFLDNWGGLWSWGSQKTDTNAKVPTTTTDNPTYQYRIDSSDLAAWTVDGAATSNPGVRLVAKDISGNLISHTNYATTQTHYSEAIYTTLPAPFRVGFFPGKSKNATGPVPAAVGIAMVSGDRNNPLDYNYNTNASTPPVTKPLHHRLSVVFDRQDSLAWTTDANPILISDSASSKIMNALPGGTSLQYGNDLITPGKPTYYLAPTTVSDTKFGWYMNFPDISTTTKLIPKGINTPLVNSGSLFYSYFLPTEADPCTGGTGLTYSNLVCDVLNPVLFDTRTTVACRSGNVDIPVGVASDYIPLGTRGAIQIGTKEVPGAPAGASKTTLTAKTIPGKSSVRFPKARVWRTVH